MQTELSLAEVDKIISPTLETLEDALLGDFCECYHSISQEHTETKCYGLDYNGTIWSACRCRKPKAIDFELEFSVEVYEDEKVN